MKSVKLSRSLANPILKPRTENDWESDYVFNSAALYLDGAVHLIYRAIGRSGLSVFGYAKSFDGVHIIERSSTPVYTHHDYFEYTPNKLMPVTLGPSGGSWGGCEDPRLTCIDHTVYMVYTAIDPGHPPCIMLTSIHVEDFLNQRWIWSSPILISAKDQQHKNWVIFPEKIDGKFGILHSITPSMLIALVDDLRFSAHESIKSHYFSTGREKYWDNWVRGAGPTPIRIDEGWLVLYHAMDKKDPDRYKLGALITDAHDPSKVLFRSMFPILEPDAPYENEGFKWGVIYCCGAVVIADTLFVYYGGADTVVCVATVNLRELINDLKHYPC